MARVLTMDEAVGAIYDDGWYWIELHNHDSEEYDGLYYLRCQTATMFQGWLECNFDTPSVYITALGENYNIDWRIWDGQPDYEQWTKEPWNEEEE